MATKEQLKAMRKKYHLGEFRNSRGEKNKSRGAEMVKRKRARSSRSSYFAPRRVRRSGTRANTLKNTILAAAIYGAGREKVAVMAEPITSKLPLGTYSDEALMLVGSYLLAKNTSGLIHEIGRSGMIIEAARVGERLALGQGISSNTASGMTVFS